MCLCEIKYIHNLFDAWYALLRTELINYVVLLHRFWKLQMHVLIIYYIDICTAMSTSITSPGNIIHGDIKFNDTVHIFCYPILYSCDNSCRSISKLIKGPGFVFRPRLLLSIASCGDLPKNQHNSGRNLQPSKW